MTRTRRQRGTTAAASGGASAWAVSLAGILDSRGDSRRASAFVAFEGTADVFGSRCARNGCARGAEARAWWILGSLWAQGCWVEVCTHLFFMPDVWTRVCPFQVVATREELNEHIAACGGSSGSRGTACFLPGTAVPKMRVRGKHGAHAPAPPPPPRRCTPGRFRSLLGCPCLFPATFARNNLQPPAFPAWADLVPLPYGATYTPGTQGESVMSCVPFADPGLLCTAVRKPLLILPPALKRWGSPRRQG